MKIKFVLASFLLISFAAQGYVLSGDRGNWTVVCNDGTTSTSPSGSSQSEMQDQAEIFCHDHGGIRSITQENIKPTKKGR